MRLWSLDPAVLDRAALVAGWREALLAQKVLVGGTRGYTRHPQLIRFRAHPAPVEAIGAYLTGLQHEATSRGYRFDRSRILHGHEPQSIERLPVTRGQLGYELEHLRSKVTARAPEWLPRLPGADDLDPLRPHPLFVTVPGDIEEWEVRP